MKRYFNLLGLAGKNPYGIIRGLLLSLFLVFSLVEFVYPQTRPDSEIIESLEFREVDIKDVLRQLAKQYNLNIVFSEAVKGLVTVQLSNVSIEQALDSIITVNGFAYTKKENVYKVTTPEEAAREGMQTRLFKLNNADATKLKETLKKVLTPSGSIEADSRSNSLVVTDALAVINKIEGMIPQLDEITSQVLIEAKLIETSLTKTEKLGIDWATTVRAIGSARKTTLPFSPRGAKWMNDVFPQPVSTSADFPTGSPYGFPYTVKGDFTFGTLDFTGLQAVLDFLKSRSNTRLIANPRVVTLNNQKATIHVGKEVPLPTYERNETTGRMQITGWGTPEKIGVQLEVTPQISPAGYIRLKIKPEVSSIDRWLQVEGYDAAPVTVTRTAESEVQIKDGQTVVIGGLVKEESFTKVSKIPILGDLPLIGLLFTRKEVSSTSTPTEKTDLLIFVTARIIKDTNEPLLAWESNLITSPPRPFKLEIREVR
jgi:type IV pilus assembly protein PilQ